MPDNKVEAVLCGKKEDVEELIKIMKKNHPLAKIEDMKIEKIKAETNFSDFHILF
ncbi:MAG: acylphosphatase [Candidatus Aenigmatarchaeota archaeon]